MKTCIVKKIYNFGFFFTFYSVLLSKAINLQSGNLAAFQSTHAVFSLVAHTHMHTYKNTPTHTCTNTHNKTTHSTNLQMVAIMATYDREVAYILHLPSTYFSKQVHVIFFHLRPNNLNLNFSSSTSTTLCSISILLTILKQFCISKSINLYNQTIHAYYFLL